MTEPQVLSSSNLNHLVDLWLLSFLAGTPRRLLHQQSLFPTVQRQLRLFDDPEFSAERLTAYTNWLMTDWQIFPPPRLTLFEQSVFNQMLLQSLVVVQVDSEQSGSALASAIS